MKYCFSIFAIFFSSLLWAISPTELETKIDKLMAPFSGSNTPGASVAVYKEGAVFFAKSYGLRDLEDASLSTPSTNYRIASLTKAFTATAIMQLREKGLLSLQSSLTEIFPQFPSYGQTITVHHLLTHTSGLKDYEVLMGSSSGQITDREVLKLLSKQTSTYFKPGTRFRYSNTGYVVLSCIVEALSHQTFQDYLFENILNPLGMMNSVAFVKGTNSVPERAFGYSPSGSGFKLTDQSSTSATLGDGGLYSSTTDLLRWFSLWTGRSAILSPESISLMTQPMILTSGEKTEYGFGWFLGSNQGTKKISHTGSTIGQKHAISFFPEKQLGIVVLTNRENAAPWDTVEEITRFVF